jgi:pimeloyl-ACP methyl ester carboxylesterase
MPAALTMTLLVLAMSAGARQQASDEWLTSPVDDRTFKSFQELFTYERGLPLDVRVGGTAVQGGIKRERLSFQSTPGLRVVADFYQPPGGGPAAGGTLVLLHGGVATGKASAAGHARNFARAGWNVLAIDLQHFGDRATTLLASYTEQEKHERLYNDPTVYLAWVAQTVKDVGRSVDLLIERKLDPRRIGLVGLSRGAMLGAIVAAVDSRLSLLVMMYGGHFDALERKHVAAACPANYIGRIAPRPVLMVNGLQDADLIKDTSVDPLYRLAKPPRHILWSDGGHMAISEENRARMLQWLRENLR